MVGDVVVVVVGSQEGVGAPHLVVQGHGGAGVGTDGGSNHFEEDGVLVDLVALGGHQLPLLAVLAVEHVLSDELEPGQVREHRLGQHTVLFRGAIDLKLRNSFMEIEDFLNVGKVYLEAVDNITDVPGCSWS